MKYLLAAVFLLSFTAVVQGSADWPKITAIDGHKVNLTFSFGQCSKDVPLTVVNVKNGKDIFSCRSNGHSQSHGPRFTGDCSTYSVQIQSVELADAGTYRLESNTQNCGCVHLEVRPVTTNTDTDARNEYKMTTPPPNPPNPPNPSDPPLNLTLIISVSVISGFAFLIVAGFYCWKRNKILDKFCKKRRREVTADATEMKELNGAAGGDGEDQQYEEFGV